MPPVAPSLETAEPSVIVGKHSLDSRAAAAARAVREGGSATESLRTLLSKADPIPREPGAVRVLRAAIRTLPDAVQDADLRNVGEFHSLFELMLGMGVEPAVLATQLEVGTSTIGRYANGASAPSTAHARLGALMQTVTLLEEGLATGQLQCLAHLDS